MPILRQLIVPLVLLAALIQTNIHLPDLLDLFADPYDIKGRMLQIADALVWLAGAWLLVRLIALFFWERFVERVIHRSAPRLVVQLGNVLIFFFALSGIITFSFGQSVTAFWTASGAFGLVIAFALRNLILDTFSGIAIHMERPFRVGDWIEMTTRYGYYHGEVRETNWRTTRLETVDHNMIVIPNSILTTSTFTNLSAPEPLQRLWLDIVLDFAVPPERVRRILMAAVRSAMVEEDGPVADPEPFVRVSAIKTDGVHYRLFYFARPEDGLPGKPHNVVYDHVLNHIDKSGLSFNYQKTDVFVSNMPWRQKHWSDDRDRVHQLRKISLFRALEEDDLSFLGERMEIEKKPPGTILVEQGDAGDSMFILAEGLLEVQIETDSGERLKVADLEPGVFFGEKSLLTGEPRSATITAATEALVCVIGKPVIAELLERNPKVAHSLSHAIVTRELANSEALAHKDSLDPDALLAEETGKFLGKLMSFFGKT